MKPQPPLYCEATHYTDGVRDGPLYIGALARLTGASVKAIRLYEAMGLLGPVPRLGVYRVYTARHVAQVRLIKQAQALGIRLSGMQASLQQGRQGAPDWSAVAAQVVAQRTAIAQEMARLHTLNHTLHAILLELQACAQNA